LAAVPAVVVAEAELPLLVLVEPVVEAELLVLAQLPLLLPPEVQLPVLR
jgi:hypothetical protein